MRSLSTGAESIKVSVYHAQKRRIQSVSSVTSVRWHSHVVVNCRTERCKARTADRGSLRSCSGSEGPSGYTTCGDAIRKIILRPKLQQKLASILNRTETGTYAFDAALGAGEYRSHKCEVFRRAIRPCSHIFEASSKLFLHWKIGHSSALWC